MFDLFRSRAKVVRIMLGGLLLLVALSMVTYLIPGVGMNTGAGAQIVAEFGKQVLTLPELQQLVQAQLRNQSLPPDMAAVLVPQVANQVITEYAVAYQAERMGFRVSETDIAAIIRQVLPQLFNGDQFAGREAYAAVLAQQNMTIPQFEGALRRQLMFENLRAMVAGGVVVSPKEVEREFHAKNDKIKIEYAAIQPAKYRSEVTVTPEEIKQYYDRTRTGFQVPEKRSAGVVVVDEGALAAAITVPDSDLRRVYEQNKEAYRVPERVHVRHILLKTTEKPKEETSKIKARAEELLKQIKAGADFAQLAKKSSEDTASAAKGGDLGWVNRGQTVKSFEEAAFTLKPGETSGVISTEYGFHILQVIEKQDAHLQSFEEVKPQLAEERKKQMVFDRMQTLSDEARAALIKNPQAAAKIAADLGLQFFAADRFGAGDEIKGIGTSPELAEALSSLRKGEVSQVVQIAPTKLAVAVVTEVFPAHQAELAAVEEQIRQRLTADKLDALAGARAQALFEKAQSLGGDLRKAAQAMGLEVKSPPEFTRDGAVEGLGSAGYLQGVFGGSVGQLLGPVDMNGQRVVYKVVAKIPAAESELAAQRESLMEELRNRKARERLELFEDTIRNQLVKSGKVKIHQDVINRLVSNYRGA
jgi:peptidyl-prolyl cis-trans isomerase D